MNDLVMNDLGSWVRTRTAAVVQAGGGDDPASAMLARESLRDLAVLYAMAVDSHDLHALGLMFHPEATFGRDGEIARGRAEILNLLGASMHGFRRMIHTPETHVVHAWGDTGWGLATGHAELVTGKGVVVAAHEYEDEYAVHDGRWVFTTRKVRFVYAARSDEYSRVLPDARRVRLPGEPAREMRGRWLTS